MQVLQQEPAWLEHGVGKVEGSGGERMDGVVT